MKIRQARPFLIVLGLIIVLYLCGLAFKAQDDRSPNERELMTLDQLRHKTNLTVRLRLADDLIPPTNKWFSSLVFGQSPTIYPLPLAFHVLENGFGLAYPKVSAASQAVFASYTPDLEIKFPFSTETKVTRYDDLSVDLSFYQQSSVAARATLAQGSPYIFVHLKQGQRFELQPGSAFNLKEGAGQLLVEGPKKYALFFDPKRIKVDKTNLIALTDEALVSFAALPETGDSSALSRLALDPIVGSEVSHNSAGDQILTNYQLKTKSGKPTLFGLLPLHWQNGADYPAKFSYQTLFGPLKIAEGTDFRFKLDKPTIPLGLDLGSLNQSERQHLTELVRADLTDLAIEEQDTYFTGKKLYRVAGLLDIAKQLQLTSEAATLHSQLKTVLTTWFNPKGYEKSPVRHFYYDQTIRGLVGEKAAFGTEQFNDHHFHYGYFINAAATLAQYDPEFLQQYQPMVDLLARDIANIDRSTNRFPYLRYFDGYAGHSWAAGFADFNDGNNQESSSEAVNAWYGLYRWARLTNNGSLSSTAEWLFSLESTSARQYWLNNSQLPEGYQPLIVSLVWGGKLDYATWFDNKPEAKLGIQLLPISPASQYLALDKDRVKKNLAGLNKELAARPIGQFKDYILMYQYLAEPSSELATALQNLKTSEIDSANSPALIYAWLSSRP